MAKFNRKINDTEIRIGEVRFGYVHVFEPGTDSSGKPDKYGACLMIPKENKEAIKMIESCIEAAKEQGKVKKWNGRIPSGERMNPLHDGDEERYDKPEYQGMMYLNAKSKNRPGVRVLEAGHLSEPMGEEDFYSGCWGAATVSFFPYDSNGNKGVGVSLGNVIKTRDDEKFSGGVSADAAFADLADDDFDL
jgi:hypothetical protein